MLAVTVAAISFSLGVLFGVNQTITRYFVSVPRMTCYEVLYSESNIKNTRKVPCSDTLNMEKFEYERIQE